MPALGNRGAAIDAIAPPAIIDEVIARLPTLLELPSHSSNRTASVIIIRMTDQLDDLDFGLYGYGRVLTDAGFFAVRNGERGFHYIPTAHLWSIFDGQPDLDDVLLALHELVLGMAHEQMDFRTGKHRQTWAVQALKTLSASDEAVTQLKCLLKPYIVISAVSLVAAGRR